MRVFILMMMLVSSCVLNAQNFTLKSNTLKGQAEQCLMLNSMGCTGENSSPQLFWDGVPSNTQSFALTIHDPDAPIVSGWWHWVVFDIPVDIRELVTNAGNILAKTAPKGVIQSKNDFGTYGYGGPCPPEGDHPHRYIITIYALDTDKLGLNQDASGAMVAFYLRQYTIQKASLVFYAKR